LRFFGRYSYALYLIHQPIFIWLNDHAVKPADFPRFMGSELPGQAAFIIIAVALSLGLALLSWRFLEQPFLRLKELFPYDSHAAMPRDRRIQTTDAERAL
jgi:peptidoglycan/LPS O-acetylase OafA/YrhL